MTTSSADCGGDGHMRGIGKWTAIDGDGGGGEGRFRDDGMG